MLDRKVIPFKGVSLLLIDKQVDKVLASMRKHYDTTPLGDDFDTFVYDLYACFPSSIKYEVFYSTVMPYVGRIMTRDVIKEIGWRIAGNIARLKDGQTLAPWVQQQDLEWCPIVILKAEPGSGFDNTFGFFYEYRVLAGTPTGLKFKMFWSLKYLRFVARSLGFKRTKKWKFKLADGQDLVQMELYLLFDPALSKDNRPGSFHFHVPTSSKTKNLQIIKQRYRIIPCPLTYSFTEMPCYRCPVGYDKCNAGCHPFTFYRKGCPRCKEETWFDPLGYGVVCVNCTNAEHKAKR